MIKIRKRPVPDGTFYEIVDFAAYLAALQSKGGDPPTRRYRIFVSHENGDSLRAAVGDDFENQIALLFRLSPALGIPYEFETAESV